MSRDRRGAGFPWLFLGLLCVIISEDFVIRSDGITRRPDQKGSYRHAYAAMMYMGTPRDYEFYMATRVMLRSLSRLRVEADLVVIASIDVPARWIQSFEQEDGIVVVKVVNLNNPYTNQKNFDRRFRLSLNKIYAWNLIDYDRVVMLDSDNLFLHKTDELFQCGQFCAVFINPCVFHTGLFVLQPSLDVFNRMLHELKIGKENPDGADQGFIGNYFPRLLDQPMFHPPPNFTKLDGTYRLPLGYQMDASYYYLKLRWSVPCGPNSVITFPSAPWLKPWYWWSWPVLPLGILWHEKRHQTLGYGAETPMAMILLATYTGVIIMVTFFSRPSLPKALCHRNKSSMNPVLQSGLKLITLWSILIAYIVPFFLIPTTVHPFAGWALYFLGSFALSLVIGTALMVPMAPVLMPWFGILGSLLVMAFPWYQDGVVRALWVFLYAFCCAPLLWVSILRVLTCVHSTLEKESRGMLLPNNDSSVMLPGINKLC